MSAGLPGLGLGGLFFVLSALLAPAFELRRTLSGDSTPGAWRQVWRQFAIALCMVVAVDLALRAVLALAALAGTGPGPGGQGLTALPLAPIGLTMALMLIVLTGAKALQLALVATAALRRRGETRRRGRVPCRRPCTCCGDIRA